jgi:type IV secretory pathway VirB2 component (pilin)
VRAVGNGKVYYAYMTLGVGAMIIQGLDDVSGCDSSSGTYVRYLHINFAGKGKALRPTLPSPDNFYTVNRGDVIGTVGGFGFDPHLHFEVCVGSFDHCVTKTLVGIYGMSGVPRSETFFGRNNPGVAPPVLHVRGKGGGNLGHYSVYQPSGLAALGLIHPIDFLVSTQTSCGKCPETEPFACHTDSMMEGAIGDSSACEATKKTLFDRTMPLVGALPYAASEFAQCYPPKKTIRQSFYDLDNARAPLNTSAPQSLYYAYYLPKCYKIAKDVREELQPLFATLEQQNIDYAVLRQQVYSQFLDAFPEPDPVNNAAGGRLLEIVCHAVSVASNEIGKPLAVGAVLAVVLMALFGKVTWQLLLSTAAGIAIITGAPQIMTALTGMPASCKMSASEEALDTKELSHINEAMRGLGLHFDATSAQTLRQIQQVQARLGACKRTSLAAVKRAMLKMSSSSRVRCRGTIKQPWKIASINISAIVRAAKLKMIFLIAAARVLRLRNGRILKAPYHRHCREVMAAFGINMPILILLRMCFGAV